MTTTTTRYRAIADILRARITDGAYPVGTKLPSIAELMREFDVPGLNTIRDAQQILVREGLVRTEQGVGAWVIADQSPAGDRTGVLQALQDARTAIDRAIAFLERSGEDA
ncbi:MAG: winged helix-turn-helix domain-containing protein [Microlunatus sp.]|nr:winged helix-turn-helix domain-containing protein [Microlunatus sp.]